MLPLQAGVVLYQTGLTGRRTFAEWRSQDLFVPHALHGAGITTHLLDEVIAHFKAGGIAELREFGEPQAGYVEQCFYHRPKAKDGRAFAALFNEELGIGAYVRYRTDTLPLLVQWKMLGEQEYVVGLEPGACVLDGRAELLRRNEAPMLAPGETRGFEVEIGVLEDRSALDALA